MFLNRSGPYVVVNVLLYSGGEEACGVYRICGFVFYRPCDKKGD